MRMDKKRFAALMTAASGAITQLAGANGSPSFNGTTWVATSFLDPVSGKLRATLPGAEITMQLEDSGSIYGSAGCNGYFGNVEVNGSSITMPMGFATTRMYCDPHYIMEQEFAYLESLVLATKYVIDEGSNLRLTDLNGTSVAEYEAYSPSDPIDAPPSDCKGKSLGPGEKLELGDAICSEDLIFGVTKKGKLMLFNASDDSIMWQAVNERGCVYGNHLEVKASGELVFYLNAPGSNNAVWGRECGEIGLKLKVTDHVLKFFKQGSISWKVLDGEEINVAGCTETEIDETGMIPL